MFDNIWVMRTPGPSLSEALNVEGGDIAFTTSGRMHFGVGTDGERTVACVGGVANDYNNESRIESTIHLEAGERIYFEYCFDGVRTDDYQLFIGVCMFSIYEADGNWHSYSFTAQEAGDYRFLIRYFGYADDSWFMVDNVQVLGVGQPDPTIPAELGDVNGDGSVNANDALALMRCALGLIPESAIDMTVADVNHDGLVNANDALMIMRAALGLVTIS